MWVLIAVHVSIIAILRCRWLIFVAVGHLFVAAGMSSDGFDDSGDRLRFGLDIDVYVEFFCLKIPNTGLKLY